MTAEARTSRAFAPWHYRRQWLAESYDLTMLSPWDEPPQAWLETRRPYAKQEVTATPS